MKKLILTLVAQLLLGSFIFAQGGFIETKSVILELIFANNMLKWSSEKLTSADISSLEPTTGVGDFKLIVKNFNKKAVATYAFQLTEGENEIRFPYSLNAYLIEVIDPQGNLLFADSLPNFLLTCNENGVCEKGEEGLCSLDCPQASIIETYPYPPIAIGSESSLSQPARQSPQPLEAPPFTPEASQRQFQISLGFVGGGMLMILVIFSLVYWYNKRR